MPAATVDIQAVSSSYPTLNLGGGGSNNGDLTVNSDETLQIGHFNRNLSTFEERMRISSAGNVGIGSTIPEAKLSVVGIGSFKEDVYIDKKLYVGGIEIGGPGGPGIGTDITTRHLRATGITTTEQLLDADGGADIAGIATAGFVHVGNLTSGRVTLAGAGGSITDSSNLTFDGSTLLVTGTLNSTVDVQINGTSVVDTALNDAVAMAIALG